MLVVSDTSPINYLVLIQQETLLPILYERVVIPPAVHEELQRSQTPEEVRQWIAHPRVVERAAAAAASLCPAIATVG